MVAVMKDIGPVTKDQKNTTQGFKFRGIDQFVNALHPVLVKHQVFVVPRVISAKLNFEMLFAVLTKLELTSLLIFSLSSTSLLLTVAKLLLDQSPQKVLILGIRQLTKHYLQL